MCQQRFDPIFIRLLEPDLHGQGVQHLHGVHRLVEGAHARLGGGVHQPVDAELDGGRVDGRAVVEEDVLPELEGVEERVGRDLPGLRGIAHKFAVGGDVDEAAADIHGHPHHFVAGRGVEVEVGDLVPVGHAQGAAALGRLGQALVRQEENDAGEDGQSGQGASKVHGRDLPDGILGRVRANVQAVGKSSIARLSCTGAGQRVAQSILQRAPLGKQIPPD